MNPLLKKLNYKGQTNVVLLNLPAEHQYLLAEFGQTAHVTTDAEVANGVQFFMAFCTKRAEVDAIANALLPKIEGDGAAWFVYPKSTSKKYRCDFNRDNGWQVIGEHGYEPVRIAAIDEDWTALRFRKVQNIKTMTRSFAMTKEGKEKAKKSNQKQQ